MTKSNRGFFSNEGDVTLRLTRQSEGQLYPPQNDNGAASKLTAQTGGLQL